MLTVTLKNMMWIAFSLLLHTKEFRISIAYITTMNFMITAENASSVAINVFKFNPFLYFFAFINFIDHIQG